MGSRDDRLIQPENCRQRNRKTWNVDCRPNSKGHRNNEQWTSKASNLKGIGFGCEGAEKMAKQVRQPHLGVLHAKGQKLTCHQKKLLCAPLSAFACSNYKKQKNFCVTRCPSMGSGGLGC